jgi:hypothetical protein
MSACCNAASDQNTPTLVRRVRRISSWVLSSVILVMVPKCHVSWQRTWRFSPESAYCFPPQLTCDRQCYWFALSRCCT